MPLFVSHRQLASRKSFPRAQGAWCEDSAGFTEIRLYGGYQTPPRQYATDVRLHMQEIGNMQWAAIQDWMCEPFMLAKTGLSVEEHQSRTIASYLELMMEAPEVPWVPVIQGWEEADYLRHVDMYDRAGIDLRTLPTVGIGSVCRRQGVKGAVSVVVRLANEGIQLHGFGLKTTALKWLEPFLMSSDSMAWSYQARKQRARCGVPSASCGNHMHYALDWRENVLATAGTDSFQMRFW